MLKEADARLKLVPESEGNAYRFREQRRDHNWG